MNKHCIFLMDLLFCSISFVATTEVFFTFQKAPAEVVGGTVLLLGFWLWPIVLGYLFFRKYISED